MFKEEVKRNLIWQQVLERIRKGIILDELKKDEHLKEATLSEELGVSRGPIREAIVQLEKEGLVQTSKNGRTKVSGFSIKDVDDLYFSRTIIETSAVEQINFPIDLQYLNNIELLVEVMEDESLSKERINYLDLKFHYSLVQLSQNKTLIQMWLSMNGLVKAIMEITNERTSSKRDRVCKHHQEILEALKLGDQVQVKQSLEAHLDFARTVLKKFFETIYK
ncbi:GntR family transcriptional regulator [bacterium LRH843]|nr:GntR family transcriptional regulator [bacterium LRH843]